MKYCSECGTGLDESVKFCPKCGHEQSIELNSFTSIVNRDKVVFPMAIRVNALLVLVITTFWIPVIIFYFSFSFEDAELKQLIGDFIFDSQEPISSILEWALAIVFYIAVWITYIQKKYLQYIDKIFYVYFFITTIWTLFLIDYSDGEAIAINFGILCLEGLLVLWIFLSNDVKKFMLMVKQ